MDSINFELQMQQVFFLSKKRDRKKINIIKLINFLPTMYIKAYNEYK